MWLPIPILLHHLLDLCIDYLLNLIVESASALTQGFVYLIPYNWAGGLNHPVFFHGYHPVPPSNMVSQTTKYPCQQHCLDCLSTAQQQYPQTPVTTHHNYSNCLYHTSKPERIAKGLSLVKNWHYSPMITGKIFDTTFSKMVVAIHFFFPQYCITS